MSGHQLPLSPAAMREIAVKLIERAAEVEAGNRSAKSDGPNVFQFEPPREQPKTRRRHGADYPHHALATLAKNIYVQRQRRDAVFDFKFTREAAWDILLDLYIQRTAGKRVMTTSACIASNAPQTTALRHIDHLEEVGLVKRHEDPSDTRVTYVEITQHAYRKMAEHLNEVLSEFTNAADYARASFAIVN